MTTKPEPDMREDNYSLRRSLELALYEEFCKKGLALILHGTRHGGNGYGPFADFALLDVNRNVILVNVQPRGPGKQRTFHECIDAYRSRPLMDHAEWYCRHEVDVSAWFEYRGKDYIQTCKLRGKERDYGCLNRFRLNNFKHYREAANDPAQALKILGEDYQHIVGRTLDTETPLQVGRCILLVPDDPSHYVAESIGVRFDLWPYRPPAQWLVVP